MKRGENNGTIIFRHKFMTKLFPVAVKVSGMRMIAFTMIIPAAIIIQIILVLFGQGIDGVVKAFTVAAGGHNKVVRPTRFGRRRGATIVVNRQLQIANAFEELIHDKTPRFHRFVRHFYDTHGYPLSKLINTPLKADIIYILMKPLEWIFLFGLYLVDTKPERRIDRQYK